MLTCRLRMLRGQVIQTSIGADNTARDNMQPDCSLLTVGHEWGSATPLRPLAGVTPMPGRDPCRQSASPIPVRLTRVRSDDIIGPGLLSLSRAEALPDPIALEKPQSSEAQLLELVTQ